MARVALYVVAAALALALSGLYLALTATPPGTGDEGADTAAPPLSGSMEIGTTWRIRR